MVKLKGVYEWELRNADTGEVDANGKQWNVISDKFLEYLFVGAGTSYTALYSNAMAVQISDSTATPGLDYRVAGRSNSFNILETGTAVTYNVDFVNLSKYTYHNFTQPGTARTIRIIGIKIFRGTGSDDYKYPNFVSFIELSTPITQNTNQFLYVKYTVFITPNLSAGHNTPNNRFINYGFNNTLFTNAPSQIGTYWIGANNVQGARVTQLLPPSDLNKVQRSVPTIYNFVGADIYNTLGNIYGTFYSKAFAVGDIVGPIGCPVFQCHADYFVINTIGYLGYFNAVYGYSPMDSVTPSVSRVYVHPAGREAYFFSDPSFPASSQGTVLISGTPTNKYPALGRIRITKTGDASDLVDETVSYTAVDVGANSITVTQDIAPGDKYRLTTTGGLPSPLVAGTDYYIIRINSTTIKLATTYDFAIAGTAIDLTTQGTGNHTLIRQNTGEYKLENYIWPVAMRNMYNLSMGIDYDGYLMPQNLDGTNDYYTNYAEGDYIANASSSAPNDFFAAASASMLRGGALNGNYLYTIQQSRKGLIPNVCRWLFNTIETSEPLCKFGSGSTIVGGVLDVGTKMYIYTSTGLYEYTFATPTVAPVLLTITGIIDNNITDACIDPVTGYMWTGHVTGLSRVNLGTLTATQYLTGTGQALEGMTTAEVRIWGGQLDAYNGRVLRGGDPNINGVNLTAWVMDDGVGYYRVKTTTSSLSCCLRKGTTQVAYLDSSYQQLYNVTITGKNIGTSTLIESFTMTNGTIYNASYIWGHMAQLNDDTFVYLYGSGLVSSTSYANLAHYKIGTPTPQLWTLYANNAADAPLSPVTRAHSTYGYCLATFRRNPLNVDGNSTPLFLWHRYLISAYPSMITYSYGWDGSTWILGNTNSRRIPKTGTQPLLNGLSVDFNNSTGGTWDTQFVSGDHYNFLHAPMAVKDNLQTVNIACRKYACESHVVENYAVTVPMSAPYEVTIPEVSDPDFRDMDTIDFVTIVKEGSTPYTVQSGTQVVFTANSTTDILSVSANIPTGTALIVYNVSSPNPYWYNCPQPLLSGVTYYAINVSTSTIRIASSYANALAGTYINLLNNGSATLYYQTITPVAGTYRASSTGVFKFAAADAGKNLTLTYTYTKFTT